MNKENITQKCATICLGIALTGCSSMNSPDPVKYNSLPTSSYLQASANDETGRMPFSYSVKVDWSQYRSIVIDPVVIYKGVDNQFGDMVDKEKNELANYMHAQFTEKLTTRFHTGAASDVKTLRLRLTLTGASKTSTFMGPVTRFDIGGGLYNGVQSARGHEGLFTGSVIYSVEIYDAANSQLLSSFVEKQYPNAYNVGATFGALDAAKKGIEKGAEELVKQLSGSPEN